MNNFFTVSQQLYKMAIDSAPRGFIEKMIKLLCKLIEFDGAFYGVGLVEKNSGRKLVIERGHVYQRAASMLNEYLPLSRIDPIIGKVVDGTELPFSCAPLDYYHHLSLPELHKFAARHHIRNLLIHGEFPDSGQVGRWLALFRGNDAPFESRDAFQLESLWPHISTAIQINLHYALHDTDPKYTEHASALLNSCGIAEAADPAFFHLLKLEWPECSNCHMPDSVLGTIIQDGIFHGRQIDLCGLPHAGYLMCIVERVPMNATLSTAERKVAHYFAKGMTNKEIAVKLGTSPNTVRMQLKTVYRKLGVHSKIGLAHAIA
jgi:DNA-binding CsgD family transcriptional regulator